MSTLIGRLVLRLHEQHTIGGVRVLLSDPRVNQEECLAGIQAALELLEGVDPRRYRVLRQYVGHVLVWPGSYTAYDTWGGVHLASRHVPGVPAPILASVLVHEATHLRIAKRGIPYQSDLRGRIEKVCVREQAAFLRQVPGKGPEWAGQVEDGLKDPWWRDSDLRERAQRSLKEAGLPDWLELLLHRPRER